MRYVVLVNPIRLYMYDGEDNILSTLNYSNQYLKRQKTRNIMDRHFPLDLELQDEIVEYIKKTNLFIVKEEVNKRVAHISYLKTVSIDFKRRD